MRRLLKFTASAVIHRVGCIPCRLQSGSPPAPLGARILTNPDDVFQHNMWDHVQWSPEQMQKAREKAEENSRERIPVEEQVRYDREANKYWNEFYEMHQNKFFKNRQWLFSEFPELLPQGCEVRHPPRRQVGEGMVCSETRVREQTSRGDQQEDSLTNSHDVIREEQQQSAYDSVVKPQSVTAYPGQHASFRILEVGCGTGNSVFPIINALRGSDAFLYCFDFSSRAIQLVKEHPDYDPAVCHAFVQDVCDGASLFPFPPVSLDIILLVFVLSSIHPGRMQEVLNRLAVYLKHGGTILFRDYGRYDLSQLRFKRGQCLSENFYMRQDGTCVYFFTKDEVSQLFTDAGLEEVQNLEDRRLQVNRRKKVMMHRVWTQSKYRKSLEHGPSNTDHWPH
ncbi:mRNA N(3)-methylcytidine methyltransferase METTL8 [Electrophorus electricus]|uniref:tRNA N(3)-cytidine methyltransferase n=1 Tax=Electrophorus electricus TaxID=8005 RepID=A0A4W4GQL8_ELEEL|nr:mRNA N(3)-methylcytidine methyltransferase METTL8 [Electrophorus electricus]XP_026877688.2 mRNA N(3)-methylcytidine methyltransferase METTL8 [Electrophorus electricus]